DQLQSQYEQKYGPGNYVPDVFIQYWSMRVMAYLASLVLLLAVWGGWLLYKNRLRDSRLFLLLCVWAVVTPFLMNTAGWLLTESGRQPWIVQGLQKTVNASSPSVSATEIWISLIAFVLSYIVLAAADLVLMLRYSRHGLAHADSEAAEPGGPDTAVPALTY
ncbi:MAG TPA: cytochrome ubiquinol oxidase subunit I, partial [Solirubrobacteraceae bacterium]|nr:cytochrome ubiquinol oxidase subunit I [Solirubrobacteraceae bacterium]